MGVLKLIAEESLCSYHVLNFGMPEVLRSYKLCSYNKKKTSTGEWKKFRVRKI